MNPNKIVYEGIRVEMAKNRLDITYIVNQTGMIYSTLLRKLKGLIPMRLDEAIAEEKQILMFTSLPRV